MNNVLLLTFVAIFAIASGGINDILMHPSLPWLDECGIQTVTRIIGGDQARPGEFPWMAGLEYVETATNISQGVLCDGFVINRRFVLTAAHCINIKDHTLIKVWLGVWKLSTVETTDKDKVKKFGIAEKIVHASYRSPRRGYDIALIKVDDDIVYTDYIRPICLPRENLALPPYQTILTVPGWGLTEHNVRSDVLLKVDLPVVRNNICSTKLNAIMRDSQMCAGGEEKLDSCKGDSGGPLMTTVRNPVTGVVHRYPHGLVSYGKNPCGLKGYPAVYTRVSKFSNWILWNIQ